MKQHWNNTQVKQHWNNTQILVIIPFPHTYKPCRKVRLTQERRVNCCHHKTTTGVVRMKKGWNETKRHLPLCQILPSHGALSKYLHWNISISRTDPGREKNVSSHNNRRSWKANTTQHSWQEVLQERLTHLCVCFFY